MRESLMPPIPETKQNETNEKQSDVQPVKTESEANNAVPQPEPEISVKAEQVEDVAMA